MHYSRKDESSNPIQDSIQICQALIPEMPKLDLKLHPKRQTCFTTQFIYLHDLYTHYWNHYFRGLSSIPDLSLVK